MSDQGPGIAADRAGAGLRDVQRVTAAAAGPGSGLTIAKAFVEAHGGTIWIDPHVTRGARVVFTVPAAVGVPAVCDRPAAA